MTIGFISDAHGHVEAFHRGLDVLERAGVDAVYFLGDAVGYLPGTGVVAAIRRLGIVAVRGNHEAMLLEPSPTESRTYHFDETRRVLSDEDRSTIASWPEIRELLVAGTRLRLMHGSPTNPVFGYVYPDTDLSSLGLQPDVTVVLGNTHRPFIRRHGDATVVNIGSCGLPRDCGRLGAVGILDDDGFAKIVRFDITEATARMRARVVQVDRTIEALFARGDPDTCFGDFDV